MSIFQNFFKFLTAHQTAYLVYQNSNRLSRTFFDLFFKLEAVHTTNFSVLRRPRGTALIEYQIPEGKSRTFFKNFRLLLLFFLHQTDHKRRDRHPQTDDRQRIRDNIQYNLPLFLLFRRFLHTFLSFRAQVMQKTRPEYRRVFSAFSFWNPASSARSAG